MAELTTIKKINSHLLTDTELRAFAVQKNKIYNLVEMCKRLNAEDLEALTTRLESAKLMKFITTQPRRFHPYLVAEFYTNATINSNKNSFTTEVCGTQLNISPRFLAGNLR